MQSISFVDKVPTSSAGANLLPTVYYASSNSGDSLGYFVEQDEININFLGSLVSVTANGSPVVGGTHKITVIEKINGIAYTHPGDTVFRITYYE